MRRADRLFQLVHLLRHDRVTTAARLARELEVSERTVYRDVQDLQRSGVPIRGEAGVGYALPPRFELPPLMFTPAEVAALGLGARMVAGHADAELAAAARSAARKIGHVLPAELADKLAGSRLFVPDLPQTQAALQAMPALRSALDDRAVLRLRYRDQEDVASDRRVRPLALAYWGRSWTLLAWCELRQDFRSFRVDRITATEPTGRTFVDEPGRTLDDFLARLPQEQAAERPPAPRPKPHGPPVDAHERAAWQELQQLGSIGPAGAHDLLLLGIRSIAALRGQDPNALYARLCTLTGERHDPCVEDALRCAVAQAEHPDLPAPWRQWHRWTPLRGQPAGTLPAGLHRSRRR